MNTITEATHSRTSRRDFLTQSGRLLALAGLVEAGLSMPTFSRARAGTPSSSPVTDINRAAPGSTVVIATGNYDTATQIVPASQMTIQAAVPATQNAVAYAYGSVSTIEPQVHLSTTSLSDLMSGRAVGLTMQDLWLSGSTGRLVNHLGGDFRRMLLTGAPNNGFRGCAGLIEDCEMTDCGDESAPRFALGSGAACKSGDASIVRRAYIHDCERFGLWFDTDSPAVLVEHCLFDNIVQHAFCSEVSGNGGPHSISYSEFRNFAGSAAIKISGSKNVECSYLKMDETYRGKLAIRVQPDPRERAYPVRNIRLHDIDLGGGKLRIHPSLSLGDRYSTADVRYWNLQNLGGIIRT